MTQKLEQILVDKYPKILKDYNGDPMLTCMAYGIDTGDGWFKLLDELMEKMQCLCDAWTTAEREVQVVAAQIKSKYASLRFYVDIHGATDAESKIIYDLIDAAEQQSLATCEECGACGNVNTKGWHRVLCDTHWPKPT